MSKGVWRTNGTVSPFRTRPVSLRPVASIFLSLGLLIPLGADYSMGDDSRNIISEVSGERIMGTIRDLEAFGSRAFDLEPPADVATYVFERFSEIGLEVRFQNLTVQGYRASNIIASIEGRSPGEPQYLFGAHHDSWNEESDNHSESQTLPAPGADDDASGLAVVIEMATVLSDLEFDASVKFVSFAAEESGLNGSTYYVQREVLTGVEYAETVVLDMVGYRMGDGNYANLLTKENSDQFAEAALDVVEDHGLNITLVADHVAAEPYSDHYPFWAAGYRGILVIEQLSEGEVANPNYHTEADISDTLSEDQMVELTKALVGAVVAANGYHDGSANTLLFMITLFGVIMISTATLLLYRKARRS